MIKKVRKALLPLSSFTDDFLPATKATPKEMMPVVDKPLIQYAVEEAAAAGITEIIFVTGRGKRIIEDHFDKAYELEEELAAGGKKILLAELRGLLPTGMHYSAVHHRNGYGFGDALLSAQPFIGDEPFAVLMSDHLIDAEPSATSQLVNLFETIGRSIIGIHGTEMTVSSNGTAADGGPKQRIRPLQGALSPLEKTDTLPDEPTGGLIAQAGRYVFSPAVFDCLYQTKSSGSVQIGLDELIAALPTFEETMMYEVIGRRYDCGSKVGYLKAMTDYGMKHPAIRSELSAYIATLNTRMRIGSAVQT